MRWGGHVARMEVKNNNNNNNIRKILMGKLKGKRSLGRPRSM
jgi:hypothetical protein